MTHWPEEPERRYRTVEDMPPYFRSRNKQKRICPECHQAALFVKPTLNPNVGIDKCPKCRYLQVVEAPAGARVPDDWTRPRDAGCRIIRFADL